MSAVAPVVPMADPDALEYAARELAGGGLVAFATDTVYGVGALATSEGARALFRAKRRPHDRPLPLMLASAELLEERASDVPPAARALAERFWPGPLTLVLPARAELAGGLGSRDGSVGFRVPDHALLRRLLELCGGALAVTSANRSGGAEPMSAWDVAEQLGSRVDLILDGGEARTPFPSTVVDARRRPPAVLRSGLIAARVEELLASLPTLVGGNRG